MKIKAVIQRMLAMCPEAWYIFIRSLQLSCVLLFGAFLLLLKWNGDMLRNQSFYMTAQALNESAQGVLLVSLLFSVLIEDLQNR